MLAKQSIRGRQDHAWAKNGEVMVRRKFRPGHLDYALDRNTFDHAEM